MKHLLNPRLKEIQISKIRQFSELAATYDNVISLTIGQPDFHTPSHIKEEGKKAIDQNKTTYAPTAGYLPLREAASHYLKSKYRLRYDPQKEILVTNGATEAIYIALRTILEEGTEVILPAPVYSGYEPVIRLCGAIPVHVDTRQTNLKLTKESLLAAITDKTRCVILPYPMNPTGVTLTQAEMDELALVLEGKEIFVLSDEIYSELIYEGEHASIARNEKLREQTIVINGLSKSHAMTGWRIGFTFAPEYLTEEMKKIHQYSVTAISSMNQYAAIEALTTGMDDAATMREEYRKRRDYLYDRLISMGMDVVKPNGAFYLFPSIKNLHQTSDEFAVNLLEKARVAVIPGDAFSDYGEGYVRISYAYSLEQLKEAMDRIEGYLKEQN
jgi:aminotransferase